jgi:hypothetical protein
LEKLEKYEVKASWLWDLIKEENPNCRVAYLRPFKGDNILFHENTSGGFCQHYLSATEFLSDEILGGKIKE